MRPRTTMAITQTAARIWLTLALASLLLPPEDRLGWWLPLHLALAGAISVAIIGAMQGFVAALTQTPAAPTWLVAGQLAAVNVGAAGVAVGRLAGSDAVLVLGATAFWLASLGLGWTLLQAWRRSLTRRHPLPIAAYAVAVCSVLAGVILGALVGADAVSGETWFGMRQAHGLVNVLGWGGVTVVGTLVTLLPTMLRVRMPTWRGGLPLLFLGTGVAALALGLSTGSDLLAAAGALAYAAGSLTALQVVVGTVRTPRRWGVPAGALHVVAGVAWYVGAAVALAWTLVRGGALGLASSWNALLLAAVPGFLVQVLLGAWAYLLPMATPGHPDDRRRSLQAFEVLGPVQVLAYNLGLLLVLAHLVGAAGDAAAAVGGWIAAVAGGVALIKAWSFPALAAAPVATDRAREIWGG